MESFGPPAYLGGKPVELGHVAGHAVRIGHGEALEVVLRGTDNVVRSEVCAELLLEHTVVGQEERGVTGGRFEQEGLEPG